MPANVPLFAHVAPAHLDHLTAVSRTRDLPAHTVVAVRGTPATHLIVVEEGALTAVHETPSGHRRRLGEFPAPCAVDKAAVLDGGGHTATWLTTTRSHLRLIPAAEFLALVDVPSVRRHVFRHLATQLRRAQEDAVLTSYTDATTRVATWLVRAATARTRLRLIPAAEFLALMDVPSVRRHVFAHLAGQLRRSQEDLTLTSYADATTRVATWLVRAATPRVPLPGAQQGLAETLGLTRVSVNRALRTLADEGLVRVTPGEVVILAPELLADRHLLPVSE